MRNEHDERFKMCGEESEIEKASITTYTNTVKDNQTPHPLCSNNWMSYYRSYL
jgi:hypothetical protein